MRQRNSRTLTDQYLSGNPFTSLFLGWFDLQNFEQGQFGDKKSSLEENFFKVNALTQLEFT